MCTATTTRVGDVRVTPRLILCIHTLCNQQHEIISVFVERDRNPSYRDKRRWINGAVVCASRALILLRSLNQRRRVSKVGGRPPRERFRRITRTWRRGGRLVSCCLPSDAGQSAETCTEPHFFIPLRPPGPSPLVRPRRLCQL